MSNADRTEADRIDGDVDGDSGTRIEPSQEKEKKMQRSPKESWTKHLKEG